MKNVSIEAKCYTDWLVVLMLTHTKQPNGTDIINKLISAEPDVDREQKKKLYILVYIDRCY